MQQLQAMQARQRQELERGEATELAGVVAGLLSPVSRGEDGAEARLEAEGSLAGLGMQRRAVWLTKRHGGAGEDDGDELLCWEIERA